MISIPVHRAVERGGGPPLSWTGLVFYNIRADRKGDQIQRATVRALFVYLWSSMMSEFENQAPGARKSCCTGARTLSRRTCPCNMKDCSDAKQFCLVLQCFRSGRGITLQARLRSQDITSVMFSHPSPLPFLWDVCTGWLQGFVSFIRVAVRSKECVVCVPIFYKQ
jgi:hypothetical protein